jgi:cell division protein FtsQ
MGQATEGPFFRPRARLRVRRPRHGLSQRAVFLLRMAGLVVLVVALLWMGYARVMASERLKVNRVELRGHHFLSEGEVRELLGPAVGENILTLNIQGLEARLTASPWVAGAVIRRTLPDTLQVVIRERQPLALAEMDQLYLMDAEGLLIDIYGPRTASFDLPIVRGLVGLPEEARRERARLAGALLADLDHLIDEVSEVQVDDSGDLRVVLKGAGEVLRLAAPPYRPRLTAFLKLRQDLHERCPRAEYFDLRFRDRIIAKEAVIQGAANEAESRRADLAAIQGR